MADIPPPSSNEMTQLISALRQDVAAKLAAAIITSAGRPHSVSEAVKVLKDVQWTLYPNPNNPVYQAWQKDARPDAAHT